MSIASMRAKLDAAMFSKASGFAEDIDFKDANGISTTHQCHVRSRVRSVLSNDEGTWKEMEELTITIRKSDISDAAGYQCKRQTDRGTDHGRWFKFSHEIESDKPTRYKAVFSRRFMRTTGADR